eukprot:5068973-Prymnesium_polylepis.1
MPSNTVEAIVEALAEGHFRARFSFWRRWVAMFRAVLRRSRYPAASLALGGGAVAVYLRGTEDEYRSVSEDALPLKCARLLRWLSPARSAPCTANHDRPVHVRRYDPDAIERVWSAHPRCALARFGQIGSRAVPFASRLVADLVADQVASRVQRSSYDTPEAQQARSERHARRAVDLRQMLTELGPTFIKFGQMLSIRPDVIPPAAICERAERWTRTRSASHAHRNPPCCTRRCPPRPRCPAASGGCARRRPTLSTERPVSHPGCTRATSRAAARRRAAEAV